MTYYPEHTVDQSPADHLFLHIWLKSLELLLMTRTLTSLISLWMSYSVIPFINCAVNSTGPIIYFVRYLRIKH